jgi:two-component system, cell cycle sensor histidine kinase and response regulator CckA
MNEKPLSIASADLRVRAERFLAEAGPDLEKIQAEDVKRLVQELQVHQVELEMQNQELRRTQAELEASRARYLDLYDFAPTGYFTLDRKGKIIEVNLTGARLLGIERRWLIDQPFFLWVAPEFREACRGHFQKAFETGEHQTCQLKLQPKDGRPLHAALETIAVQNSAGEYSQYHIAVSDITFHKQAEEEIERLASFPQLNPNPVLEVDTAGQITYANPAALETAQKLGFQDTKIFLPNDLQEILQGVTETEKHQFYRELEIKEAFFAINIAFISQFQVLRLFLIEITQQKRAADEIKRNEARLASVLRVSQYPSRSIQDLLDFALHEVIALTRSKIGYIYFYDHEKQEFTLNTWSREVMKQCSIAEPKTLYHLEKTGIWGEAVRQRRPIIVNDFQAPNPWKKGVPEGHARIDRYLTIPVFSARQIVAVVGIGNKATDYDESDVLQLTLIMDAVWQIAERRRAQEALHASEERYRMVADYTHDMEYWVSPERKILYMSPACERLTGYPAQGFVDDPQLLDRIVHPEDRVRFTKHKEDAISHTQIYDLDFRLIHRNGGEFWVNHTCQVVYGVDGSLLGRRVCNRDITAKKRAQDCFQNLIHNAPIGIFIVQDGKFAMINPGFEVITGYHAQELLGQDCLGPVAPEYKELVRKKAVQRLKKEGLPPYEYGFVTRSGETGWVMETVTPTQYHGKKAVLGYFMDITPLKKLEGQFFQAQKMEAVGTLAGGIAHDFNNILTGILGNIGLAALDDEIVPRVKARLVQAEAACLRAQALSQQLLTFAKGGAPVKKLFSVAELLTEATAFICIGSPVKSETTCPENLWSIEADPGQIGQVFQNLTINAIQAMPTGGTIQVWAENLTLVADSELPLGAGRYIKISVRDQGMGIPAENLPRIFDPYFTTKHEGSGLGLASVFAIIENHHGHIAVESKPGAGTTFTIYLPAVARQVAPAPEEDSELLVGKGKILVMDDEVMILELLEAMLDILGYEGEFAQDGGEAVERFVQAQASGQAFAAVILDLTVPGGMGGKETMARLREIDPQVKALVSSGYSNDAIMADFQKYGFSGVIAKPYQVSELSQILHDVIMKKV